jgi:hypothetical protein
MRKAATISLSAKIHEKLEAMPAGISESIRRSVHQANKDPELLASAFKLRLSMPPYEDIKQVGYRADEKFRTAAAELSGMTKLPVEQVVRLCIEAYVYRLD